ncbi:MAG: DUF4388 domain-containing protein [Thermoanaerobaculales bacterium]|nr:DUF4388 domain-containing protein [Thermoanaerobaculales bacterium]
MTISGNLRTMPFADLLQWVSQSRKTGTLAIEGDPYNKKIYFRDGLVVAASSENPTEFLGYYLVGWGHVGDDELQELLDMQEQYNTLLGELLVIIGRLTRDDLMHILQVKTEETIYDLFTWDEGDFRFLDNILPAKKFQPLNLPVDMIILEGVRRQDEWQRCSEKIEDVSWVPKLIRAVDVRQIGQTELGILREIDGRNSIERIALNCRIAPFHVMYFVFQGMSHQLFVVSPPDEGESEIPGFSSRAWRTLIHEAELILEGGDLGGAFQRLADIREKYGDHREVNELATGLEGNIRSAVENLELENSVVLKLAIPAEELTTVQCTPQEGFLLSRINGVYTLGEIMAMVPGADLDKRVMIASLVKRELVKP